MKISRMFFNDNYKGSRNYLKTQRGYEIARTLIYFLISGSLFAAGWISTGSRLNLLTIVAVLGCLPACKSAVDMIMYLRYKGCDDKVAEQISLHEEGLSVLYDLVFTSYEKNHVISHITVRGNTLCGYTDFEKFDEQAFNQHIDMILKKDNFKDVSVKIFRDLSKYTDRMEQMKQLEEHPGLTKGIMETLKSVSL